MTVRFPPGRHLGQSQAETRGVSGYQTPAELREQADMMAVALAQPHRLAAVKINGEIAASPDDARLGTALGRLCAHHRPMPLAEHLELAGEDYAKLYRRAISFLGLTKHLPIEGLSPGEVLSDEDLQRRKELELKRLGEVEALLVSITPPLKSRMHCLCVLDMDPPNDHVAVIVYGLGALARYFKLEPKNFRDS